MSLWVDSMVCWLRVAVAVVFVQLLLVSPASASTPVAVLDFDAYGAGWDDAQLVAQGLRDGFLEGGRFDPIASYEIAERLAAGHEDALRRARQMLTDARRQLDAGKNTEALRMLSEVLSLHELAGSRFGRRSELADAHYYLAVGLQKSGRSTDAVQHLVEVLYLYPGYDATRARSPSGSIKTLFGRARTQIASDPPRTLPPDEMQRVADRLGVAFVVAGWIDASNRATVRLYGQNKVLAEEGLSVGTPIAQPGDVVYADFAASLSVTLESHASQLGLSGPSPFEQESKSISGDAPLAFDELPTIDAEAAEIQEESTEEASTSRKARKTRVRKTRVRTSKSKKKVKVRGAGGAVRYDRPLTQRWWFWTASAVVVGGGGYYLYTVLSDPLEEPEDGVDEGAFDLSVDTSGLDGASK